MNVTPNNAMEEIPLGRSRAVRSLTKNPGTKVAILNFGPLLPYALEAAEQVDATVIDMRFVKPLDGDAIVKAAKTHDILVTLEDGCIAGGAGSAVNEYLQQQGILKPLRMLGLPDSFILQGTQQEMYREHGLDGEGIANTIKQLTC